ncbi:MAG TPA: tetratricopeptide repeat protein [Acidobacteriota bacterium]|jgi:tetratricopeptide (TPR) repeat protein|nr:tetratricopeptide repeat protein [Acidobacteriota bacterium]
MRIRIAILFLIFSSGIYLQGQTPSSTPAKPPSSSVADAYYHFTLARFYDSTGNSNDAISEYELALKSDTSNSQILAEYAAALADMGRTDDALQKARQAIQADPNNVDAHLLIADIYSRSPKQDPKSQENAIGEYEKVLKVDPDNSPALSALGRLYVRANQFAKAEQALQNLVNHQGEGPEDLFLLAISQVEQQRFAPALENVKRLVQFNPGNIRVLMLQGFIFERVGDNEKALATYQEVLKLQPDNSEAKRHVASLLAEKGKSKDATEMLEELAKRNPFDSSVLLELGKTQREQKKHGEAIATFRSAAKVDPENIEISYWLAATLADTGQREEALAILKKVLEPQDKDRRKKIPILLQIGSIQREDAQYDAAIGTFQQLLREFPDSLQAYLYLADTYRQKKDYPHAAETLSKGRQKFPDDKNLVISEAQIVAQQRGLEEGLKILDDEIRKHSGKTEEDKALLLRLKLNRAQLFFDQRAFQRAENYLQELNKELPENDAILFQLAAVYEREKKNEKAEEVFRKLLQKNTENANVLNYLGYMWADRGENLQQALEYIQKAVELDPFNGAYLDSLGWAQFKLNDLKGAEANLNKAAKIVRNDPTIHEHLGDLYERLGNYPEALQAYRLSLTYSTEPKEAEKIREKIKKLDKLTKK